MSAEEAYRFAKRIEALNLQDFPRKESTLRSIAIAIVHLSNAEIGILTEILKHDIRGIWDWGRFIRAVETRPLTKARAWTAYNAAEIYDHKEAQYVRLTKEIAESGREWNGA